MSVALQTDVSAFANYYVLRGKVTLNVLEFDEPIGSLELFSYVC